MASLEGEGAEVSRSLPIIEAKIQAGVCHADIMRALKEQGLALLENTYFTYLRRYRGKHSIAERRGRKPRRLRRCRQRPSPYPLLVTPESTQRTGRRRSTTTHAAFPNFEMRTPMQNTIHFVLQAKGGIGKSFVSTLLAQYLLNETGAVRCFDTDQENTTFTHYEALNVRHVTVANSSRLIEPKKFDGLMETLLTEEATS